MSGPLYAYPAVKEPKKQPQKKNAGRFMRIPPYENQSNNHKRKMRAVLCVSPLHLALAANPAILSASSFPGTLMNNSVSQVVVNNHTEQFPEKNFTPL
jgi:hypothetical protein